MNTPPKQPHIGQAYTVLFEKMGSFIPADGHAAPGIPYGQGMTYVEWYLNSERKGAGRKINRNTLKNWMKMVERIRPSSVGSGSLEFIKIWFRERHLLADFRESLEAIGIDVLPKDLSYESPSGMGQDDDQTQWPCAAKIGNAALRSALILEKSKQLKASRALGDRGVELECLETLATLEAEEGHTLQVMEYRQCIVTLCEAIGDPIRILVARNELAVAQYHRSCWTEAVKNLEGCLALWGEQCGTVTMPQHCDTYDYLAVNLRAIARSRESAEKLDEALGYLKTSVGWRRRLNSPLGEASTLHRLGHVQAQKAFVADRDADFEEVQKCLRDGESALNYAAEIRRNGGFKLDLCRTINTHATLLVSGRAKGAALEIEKKLMESRQIAEQYRLDDAWHRSMLIAARHAKKLKRYDQLKQVLDEIGANKLRFHRSLVSDARYFKYRQDLAEAMRRKKDARHWQGEHMAALRKLREPNQASKAMK